MGHDINGPYDEACCPVFEYCQTAYFPVSWGWCNDADYSIYSHLFYGYEGYYHWPYTQQPCDWAYCVYGAIGLSSYGCVFAGGNYTAVITGCWRVFGMSQNDGTFPPYPTEGGAVEKIAFDYGMMPQAGGVFEPDFHEGAELATLMLANKSDKTNVLIQYDPLLMLDVPYIVTGALTPDATGNYTCESGYNGRPTYVGPGRLFFIWWDGIDSWYVSSCVGDTTGLYWKRTALCLVGTYDPFGGAAGTATIAAGPR